MSKIARSAVKWHPLMVLIVYAALVSGYRAKLDVHLKYIRPQIPAAPEDVIFFGFWLPWSIIAVWFMIASAMSYRLGSQRNIGYWLPLFAAFVLLSVLDFHLYSVLERQVLGGRL